MPTTLRRLCGQRSTAPSGVDDQSWARIRPPISPPPASTALVTSDVWSFMVRSFEPASGRPRLTARVSLLTVPAKAPTLAQPGNWHSELLVG